MLRWETKLEILHHGDTGRPDTSLIPEWPVEHPAKRNNNILTGASRGATANKHINDEALTTAALATAVGLVNVAASAKTMLGTYHRPDNESRMPKAHLRLCNGAPLCNGLY